MTEKERIEKIFAGSVELKKQMQQQDNWSVDLLKATRSIIDCFRNGGKVLFFGNGGSAADAQHIAAELSGRFKLNRPALHAEALHSNPSYLTAVANDYGFREIYARLIEGTAKEGDIIVALSTSGDSDNIVHALQTAKSMKGIKSIGFTGLSGGKMKNWCDICLHVPSENTARIQEVHILWGHIICEMVEDKLFS